MDKISDNEQVGNKLLYFGRKISVKYPSLRPFLILGKRLFFSKPRFSGWGMTTQHELPWIDEYDWKDFQKTNQYVKENFQFISNSSEVDLKNIDTLLWRHWIVSYSVRHAIKFSKDGEYNFVECGVGIGITTFFALREVHSHSKIKKIFMHLYDSWDAMREKDLLNRELSSSGRYSGLDIDITKRNLSEFSDHLIFHRGYIPDSFHVAPESPNSVAYLHIDLNSAKPTKSALEFFYPKISSGGVILFDDYGDRAFVDTKKVIDEFFYDKPGSLLKLPTGQAIYYQR